jgi:glycosyltransferase involved in cell wall biosynthesis
MLQYFGAEKSRERLRTAMTKALRLSPLHKHWLRQMSVILAANGDTLKLLQALGCENVSLMCDTAIPSDYFYEGPRHFEKRSGSLKLLWVGRMLTRKALPLALDAMKEIRSDVTLTIAGDGIDPLIVRGMIRERNLERRVFWKGRCLTQTELRMAYAEHDAMLFTSLRDSYGSHVLEAMAMGLPIICLNLHGARDFVPDAGSLKVSVSTLKETVKNLAAAIEEFSQSPAPKQNQRSMHVWNFARTLDWSARAELAENLYQKVLARTHPLKNAGPTTVAVGI